MATKKTETKRDVIVKITSHMWEPSVKDEARDSRLLQINDGVNSLEIPEGYYIDDISVDTIGEVQSKSVFVVTIKYRLFKETLNLGKASS